MKICMICQKQIKTDKDNYVRVTDYFQGKEFSEFFYHNKCYQARLKGGTAMQRMALSLGMRTHKLLDKMDGGNKDVAYVIE